MPRLSLFSTLLLAKIVLGQSCAAKDRLNVLILMVGDLITWLLEDSDRYAGKVIATNIRVSRIAAFSLSGPTPLAPLVSPFRSP